MSRRPLKIDSAAMARARSLRMADIDKLMDEKLASARAAAARGETIIWLIDGEEFGRWPMPISPHDFD